MKSTVKRGLGIVLGLAIVAALVIPKLVSQGESQAAPTAPPPRAQALQVEVHEVLPERLIERLSTTGTLRANEQVELASEIAGKVSEIFFREGSQIERGQALLRIDATELEAERDRARFRAELAERREGRQKELLDQGVTSQQDYDFALNELNVLRSELRLIEAQLLKTEIRAPFSGTIGLRYVSAGSFLSPQTRIATLQDLDPIKVDFAIPEQYAAQARPGTEVDFKVKGSDETFHGRVFAVEPGVDTATRSLQLRAESPNPSGVLRPGAFADIQLLIRQVDDALVVPSIAVIPELGGKKLFVYADGKAEARQVETGIRTESGVQILRGLNPGDQVITSGVQQLQDGMPVTPEASRG